MNLEQWFEKGMNPDTYIDAMQEHKDDLLHIYHTFTPPDDALNDQLAVQNLRVIVLTEDWCGDAMLNVPVLLRMAEKTNIPVSLLLRDDNLELMDQYLTNGKSRSIPIFIFIDENGNEVASWGPRAEEIQQFVDKTRYNLPPQDADNYKEKVSDMLQYLSESFRTNAEFWHTVYTSIRSRLKEALAI